MSKFTIPQVDVNATPDERRKIFFDALYSTDLSEEVEKKNGLTYISWSQAWKVMKQFYPSANYTIHTNSVTGQPFWESEIGLMVHTSVEADGIEYHDWLPVMDFNNRSMKTQSYNVTAYDKFKKQFVEKRVEAATTFDINSAIQRSMVRCLARHGLGLYIYNGFDHLTDEPNADPVQTPQQRPIQATAPQYPQQPNRYSGIRTAISLAMSTEELLNLYNSHRIVVDSDQNIRALFTQRKNELMSNLQTAA